MTSRRDIRWRELTDFLEALGSPPRGLRRDQSASGATCLELDQCVSVVFGAVYLAAAIDSTLAYGVAIAFAVFMATSIRADVASLLFPVDHALAQAVSVDGAPTTRLEADRYCMGGRRRVPRGYAANT